MRTKCLQAMMLFGLLRYVFPISVLMQLSCTHEVFGVFFFFPSILCLCFDPERKESVYGFETYHLHSLLKSEQRFVSMIDFARTKAETLQRYL